MRLGSSQQAVPGSPGGTEQRTQKIRWCGDGWRGEGWRREGTFAAEGGNQRPHCSQGFILLSWQMPQLVSLSSKEKSESCPVDNLALSWGQSHLRGEPGEEGGSQWAARRGLRDPRGWCSLGSQPWDPSAPDTPSRVPSDPGQVADRNSMRNVTTWRAWTFHGSSKSCGWLRAPHEAFRCGGGRTGTIKAAARADFNPRTMLAAKLLFLPTGDSG